MRQNSNTITSAFCGRNECCETAEAEKVITDLRLEGAGGRQGLDVVSRARKCLPRADIVLFTAFGGSQVREEAIRRGAIDLWEKSMAIREMVRRVRKLGKGG